MNYLQSIFNQELNDDGVIDIRGNSFFRDQVLLELDPEAYKETFELWKNERNENLLKLADELLDIEDNKPRFNALKQIFTKGRILPFIGAGLSMPSGFPSWREFLLQVQAQSDVDNESFKQLLEKGEFELAAQCLDDDDSDYLQEQLFNIFGNQLKLEDIHGVVRRLPEFFFERKIITTNYDNILQIVFDSYNVRLDVYNGLKMDNLPIILTDGMPMLLKLHGSYRKRNERILTLKDYEKHYSENNKIENNIETLCISSSLLFLGCSLSSDRIFKLMQSFVDKKGVDNLPKHYAFISRSGLSEGELKSRRRELQRANIYPIWYDGEHDECIEALLLKLSENQSN